MLRAAILAPIDLAAAAGRLACGGSVSGDVVPLQAIEPAVALPDPARADGAGVAAASFSPDGRWVVTGSRQGTARVWDAATGAPVTPLLKHGRGQIRVAFSPDGRRLVTGGGDYGARLWDAATGDWLGESLRPPAPVNRIGFSPDAEQILIAGRNGTIQAGQLRSGRLAAFSPGLAGPVTQAQCNADSSRLGSTI